MKSLVWLPSVLEELESIPRIDQIIVVKEIAPQLSNNPELGKPIEKWQNKNLSCMCCYKTGVYSIYYMLNEKKDILILSVVVMNKEQEHSPAEVAHRIEKFRKGVNDEIFKVNEILSNV